MRKDRVIYTVVLLTCIIGFWLFENFYTPDTYSDTNGNSSKVIFENNLLPSSKTGAVVQHSYFMLSYSEPHAQYELVAYQFKKEHLNYDDKKRP